MLGTRGGAYERKVLDYLYLAFEPQRASPFRISRDYVASLVATMKALVMAARKDRDRSVVALPPGVFFMNRLQFGFYSVLARLDAEVDYAGVEREFLDLPSLPPPP